MMSKTAMFCATEPLVSPLGFREYDARWLIPEDINLPGLQRFGRALGVFYRERYDQPRVVVGHDWRSYSVPVKHALIIGLMAAGCHVLDIGLALSPTAYFAQYHLSAPCLAMVTASHNENGWTGVKMGFQPPLTLLPHDVAKLKELTFDLNLERLAPSRGGHYQRVEGMRELYLDDLKKNTLLEHVFKVVVACGNGTAGTFAPQLFESIGARVVRRHCDLDASFPHHNPNPEDVAMLSDLASVVVQEGADIGFAFDGDGDRCGVVGPDGHEIFSDKIGLLLARHMVPSSPGRNLVVDVKSTALFMGDPVLAEWGAKIHYWKTGHSHMKAKIQELDAIAGFEKSGHAFFCPPFGRGYDDGLLTALMILRMLDAEHPKKLLDLYGELTPTWLSPTMSPYCPDDEKYTVVERLKDNLMTLKRHNVPILGQTIKEIMDINGVRITLEDGTWGLVRASSNKPNLVVVVESGHSKERMTAMFDYIQDLLRREGSVGAYDQALTPC